MPHRIRRPLTAVLLAASLTGCREEEPLPETPPRQISESPFHYPEELWDERIEGRTMLRVYVTTVGQVDSVQIEEPSGYPAFDSAAVEGATRLRFEPAKRGDEPVGVWVLLPVQFDMADAPVQPQDQL